MKKNIIILVINKNNPNLYNLLFQIKWDDNKL